MTQEQIERIHAWLEHTQDYQRCERSECLGLHGYWPELTDADAMACLRRIEKDLHPHGLISLHWGFGDGATDHDNWVVEIGVWGISDTLRVNNDDQAEAIFAATLDYLEDQQ